MYFKGEVLSLTRALNKKIDFKKSVLIISIILKVKIFKQLIMKRFYLTKLAILVVMLLGWNINAIGQPVTFYYTGAMQRYTVPAYTTAVGVNAVGAVGGWSSTSQPGGYGGRVQCTLTVTPGQVLYIVCGGAGKTGIAATSVAAGFNDSGANGGWCSSISSYGGGSGGGASDIRIGGTQLTNRVVVAGGGGGAGCNCTNPGGHGGGLVGANAIGCSTEYNGVGGTQTGGGLGGTYSSYGTSGSGVLGWGGIASTQPFNTPGSAGGGGGGGYYGGAGGSWGGGGGGSSWTDPVLATAVVHTQGYLNTRDSGGYITLTPNCNPATSGGVITGTSPLCGGSGVATFTESVAGGYWLSSNTAIATVGTGTGIVTAVSTGAVVISYAVAYPCGSPAYATYNLTVAPPPNPITGSTNICTGIPTTFSDAGGGTWSSSNIALVTIGSTTGIATGINVGNATITYTLPSGCYGTLTTTVNVSPSLYSVTGGGAYCAGGAGTDVFMGGSDLLVNYKLYNNGTLVSTTPGGGSYIDFGVMTAAGTYSVIATNTNGGCVRNMSGNPVITINPVPAVNTVINGGSYCSGGTGVHIGLNGSVVGVNYQLFKGTGSYGSPMGGTSAALDFGLITPAGTYTVNATYPLTGCSSNMTGSAVVTVNPLPDNHTVINGGSYCLGGSGVHVGLDGSTIGTDYQLVLAGTGSTVLHGNGSPLDFGLVTATGNYTVLATNTATGCTNLMSSSATVTTNALPSIYPVTGGGGYCVGSAGSDISLAYSIPGVNYQLWRGTTQVGSYITGIGGPIDFGNFTVSATYYVIATNATTGCTSTMLGSPTIFANPLPTAINVGGGGHYCSGSAGRDITLSPATPGISYQLMFEGRTHGLPVTASSSTVDFGYMTAPGRYTVMATNPTTSCSNNMLDTANVVIDALPTLFVVGGGGNYCAGFAGVDVNLSGSETGVNYQLYHDGSVLGSPISGSGSLISFGLRTTPGNYTIKATNTATGCSVWMSGSVAVNLNPLPSVYNMTGGGTYCSNGVGVTVGLNYSTSGINYQLMRNGVAVGTPLGGASSALNFGLQMAPGNYTVVATNVSTGCVANMSGTSVVNVTPAPVVYHVTGGGSFCSDGTGVHVGIGASNTGVSYQLFNGAIPSGSALPGNGTPLDFGLRVAPGTYKVIATNTSNGCMIDMADTANVIMNLTPSVYTVTGGGSYCSGSIGVDVGMSYSDAGVQYQLYLGGSPVSGLLSGTSGTLSFGYQTADGTYSVRAVNPSTACVANMSGIATVVTNPLPRLFTVTGGGSFCQSGSGVHVGLSNSAMGVNYQLFNSITGSVGSALPGTNTALDFGLQTGAGSYTVLATNSSTPCNVLMTGSANVVVNPLPHVDTVTGGGNYCAGGTGVTIGLTGSQTGINYILSNGSGTVGLPWLGTNTPIDFGLMTAAGAYSVRAINPATSCSTDMFGTQTVGITPIVVPTISASAFKPSPICASTVDTFYSNSTNGGSAPVYSWSVSGGTSAGSSSSYYYTPSNGDVVTVTMTSNANCATPATVSASVTMSVIANVTPSATISANTGDTVCQGANSVFTIFPINGGSSPVYHWYKNGTYQASGSTFSYSPATGDNVYAELVSSITCVTADSVASNHLNMVSLVVPNPTVTISASPAIVGLGQYDTLTATVTNGGPNPTYQWYVNGSPTVTSRVFITNQLSNNDSVSVNVLSSGNCGGKPGSGHVIVRVRNVGIQSVANNSSFVIAPNPNKGSFNIKGAFGSSMDEEVTLELTNMLGQVVYSSKLMTQSGSINEQVQINNNLANGMYILTLRSGSEISVINMVIEQ